MLSSSAVDRALTILWPLGFATTAFFMFGGGPRAASLGSVALGSAVMGVWTVTSVTASSALQRERMQGTLELLVASPTSLSVVLLAITVAPATIGLYCVVVTLLWARFLFGIDLPIANVPLFVGAVLATVVTIGALGFLMAVMFVRSRRAWALGAVVSYPVWLLSGFLVPMSLLPHWARPIAWVLGPTWGMRAIRSSAMGGPALVETAVCLAITAAYVASGVALVDRMLTGARKHGTLSLR